MANETVRLAQYAAALRYEDIPAEIIGRAKECIADTVAAIICGAALPWSRIVIAYAERTGPGGEMPYPRDIRAAGNRPRSGIGKRCAGPRLRARQLDPARRRRSSRRDPAAAGTGDRPAAGSRRAGI